MEHGQNSNIDKINIKLLEFFKKDDPLFAEKLNAAANVLRAMGALGPTSQVLKGPDTSHFVRMFKVKELALDHVICFEWNGLEKGEDEVKVALPFLMRQTDFNTATRTEPKPRADISYVYSEFNIRVATNAADETEDQILVDSYEEDDIIFAMKGIFGNTSVYHDDEKEEPIFWVDMNLDGRYWAQDDDPPESS